MNSGERFVARPSIPRLILHLVGALLFVVAGLWMASLLGEPPRPGREWIGWLSVTIFGALAIVVVRQLFDRHDQIVIDEKGLHWKRWSAATIPWAEIEGLREVVLHRQKFLCIDLVHPENYASTTLLGRLAKANKSRGFGDIAVNAMGTDKNFADVKAAAFDHWHRRRSS